MEFFISGETDVSVYDYFRETRKVVEDRLQILKKKDYGSALSCISIIPIIVESDILEKGFYSERKLFQKKDKDCDYRLRIDLELFRSSDINNRNLLLVRNLIETIRSLGIKTKKSKLDFEALELEKDILDLFNIDLDTINSVALI